MTSPKKVCNTCGGSGEIGYFQGESRFFVTREECPVCFGFGYLLEESDQSEAQSQPEDTGNGSAEQSTT